MKRIVKRIAPLPVLAGIALVGCSGDDDADSSANQSGDSGTSTGGAAQPTGGTAQLMGGTAQLTGGTAQLTGGSFSTGGTTGASGGTASGGTPGSVTGFSSGLPRSSTLDSLSPTDLVTLCESSQDYLEQSSSLALASEGLCRYGGAFVAVLFEPQTDEELRQMCQQSYDECIAEPLEREPCATSSTCTATVAEFESCVDAYPELLASFDQIPSCSTITLDDLAAVVAFVPVTPPGCASLWEKCPEENQFGSE